MLAVWLIISSMLYSLRLSNGRYVLVYMILSGRK